MLHAKLMTNQGVNKMNITLSKKQYKDLIKVIHLGEWLLNSYRIEESEMEFRDIEQHIYSYAKQFGLEDLIVEDKVLNGVYPTAKLEDMLYHYIEDYDNEAFWDGLIEQLATMDLLARYSEKRIINMDPFKRIDIIEKFKEKYEEEFSKNGLKNLTLKIAK